MRQRQDECSNVFWVGGWIAAAGGSTCVLNGFALTKFSTTGASNRPYRCYSPEAGSGVLKGLYRIDDFALRLYNTALTMPPVLIVREVEYEEYSANAGSKHSSHFNRRFRKVGRSFGIDMTQPPRLVRSIEAWNLISGAGVFDICSACLESPERPSLPVGRGRFWKVQGSLYIREEQQSGEPRRHQSGLQREIISMASLFSDSTLSFAQGVLLVIPQSSRKEQNVTYRSLAKKTGLLKISALDAAPDAVCSPVAETALTLHSADRSPLPYFTYHFERLLYPRSSAQPLRDTYTQESQVPQRQRRLSCSEVFAQISDMHTTGRMSI
nr:hypothetical protein CFP56_03383 [Quercus suber]